jgi:hypothetical protein
MIWSSAQLSLQILGLVGVATGRGAPLWGMLVNRSAHGRACSLPWSSKALCRTARLGPRQLIRLQDRLVNEEIERFRPVRWLVLGVSFWR